MSTIDDVVQARDTKDPRPSERVVRFLAYAKATTVSRETLLPTNLLATSCLTDTTFKAIALGWKEKRRNKRVHSSSQQDMALAKSQSNK
jgi:hypothetical protein